MKDFIINVGPQGTFKPSGKFHSVPSDVDEIFEKFEANATKKITLYFHGGLVNEKRGIETAVKMEKHFSSIGQAPVCVVWETGLLETLSSNISKISETGLYRKLIKILIKKISSRLGFDIAEGRGTHEMSDPEIEAELSQPNPFENYTHSRWQNFARGASDADRPVSETELEAEFMIEVESDLEIPVILTETKLTVSNSSETEARGFISTIALVKHLTSITLRVIKRFLNKRDHDFYPTIVEELFREFYIAETGAWVWNSMKLKARDMWKDNSGLQSINQHAGRYLLDKIAAFHKKYPDTEINLVGHSAGSIAICNLLNASAAIYPELIYNTIIFMAPACRTDLFNQEIALKPERYKRFRMFTMTDKNEKKDILVPFVYTHSLLYLISGVLENEGKDFDAYILGLERHAYTHPPYDSVSEIRDCNIFLFKENTDHIIFSQTLDDAVEGLQTTSLSHGGFDDDEKTINSIKFLLS